VRDNEHGNTASVEDATLKGKKIYAFSGKESLLHFIANKHGILIAMNAEKIMNPDPDLKRIINANYGYPDGSGAVLALRSKGKKATKIPGTELWQDIIHQFADSKSFYLIGSQDEVIQNTVSQLRSMYPSINILNSRNGFIHNQEEKEAVKEDILRLKPDIVFIAMGTPKQEYLMEEFLSHYGALYMGLGGSFDIFSGSKKRAPELFLKLHLEWLYRLIKEPTRIKRQLNLVKFFFFLLTKRM